MLQRLSEMIMTYTWSFQGCSYCLLFFNFPVTCVLTYVMPSQVCCSLNIATSYKSRSLSYSDIITSFYCTWIVLHNKQGLLQSCTCAYVYSYAVRFAFRILLFFHSFILSHSPFRTAGVCPRPLTPSETFHWTWLHTMSSTGTAGQTQTHPCETVCPQKTNYTGVRYVYVRIVINLNTYLVLKLKIVIVVVASDTRH